jgi:hypothetical protein
VKKNRNHQNFSNNINNIEETAGIRNVVTCPSNAIAFEGLRRMDGVSRRMAAFQSLLIAKRHEVAHAPKVTKTGWMEFAG